MYEQLAIAPLAVLFHLNVLVTMGWMTRPSEISLFVSPSPSSVAFVIVGTFAFLTVGSLSFLHDSGLIRNALLGSDSQFGLAQSSSIIWSDVIDKVFGNSILNKLLFFIFWMMIGLVVFIILNTIGRSVAETEEELASLSYVHASKRLVEQRLLNRWLFRIIAVVGLCLTFWALVKFILPFSLLSSRVWLNAFNLPAHWLYGAMGIAALMLALHFLVIWLRLLVLRPRVFGAWDRFVD